MQLCARGTKESQLRHNFGRTPGSGSGHRSETPTNAFTTKSAYRKPYDANYSREWTRHARTSLGGNRKQFDLRSFDHGGVLYHQGPSLASDPLHGYSLARLCHAAQQECGCGIGTGKYLGSATTSVQVQRCLFLRNLHQFHELRYGFDFHFLRDTASMHLNSLGANRKKLCDLLRQFPFSH